MQQFIKANIIRADLVEIDRQFTIGIKLNMSDFILLKHTFLTISNFVDFELTVRPLYRTHMELSKEYKEVSKEYAFAKYLRNKFVGHIKQELIEKAIEWKPELRYSLKRINEPEIMAIYNLFILETAINTYVDAEGKHTIFDSETDLVYPPDWKRFMIFLTKIIKSSIDYLTNLTNILSENVEMLEYDEKNMDYKYWLKAGKVDFKFIKK